MILNIFMNFALLFSTLCRAKADFALLEYLNDSADPCEDFYEYACGNFKNVHPLTDNALTVDHFTLLEEKLTNLLHTILTTNENEDDPVALKKAKSVYRSCTNILARDADTMPESTILKDIKGFPLVEADRNTEIEYGWNDIAEAINKYGIPMIFTIGVLPSLTNGTKNLIYISEDTLQNPTLLKPASKNSFEERLEKDLYETATRKPKVTSSSNLMPFDIYLRKIAYKLRRNFDEIASDEEIETRIGVMSDFMRGIYKGGFIPENVTIEKLPENEVTLRELNEWTRRQFEEPLDWVQFLSKVFQNSGVKITPETEIITYSGLEKYLYGILNWVEMHSPDTIKNFVLMRIFLYMAPDSDSETREAFEEYYRQKNYALYPRWKYCTRQIIDSVGSVGLSFALAYEYQLRYYNVNLFEKVLEIIENIHAVFKDVLFETPWMDDEMKDVALTKLENLITIMAYPDFITDLKSLDKFYENLRICKWDHYGNARRLRSFKFAYQLSQLSNRDRTFWNKSPFETNAYYNRQNNRIIIPVAMLNPEFFGGSNQVLNYARIGSIIGHEITHGFDKYGQMYDKDGAVHSWGSHSHFGIYSKCFEEQYSKYYINEIESYVNGKLTLNENLADNGGTKTAYRAVKKLIKEGNLNSENFTTFTADQLFFLGFGSMWCSNPSTAYLVKMKNDVHAMSKWRVNGVLSNMDEFSKAFNCPRGSPMNPEEKCTLW